MVPGMGRYGSAVIGRTCACIEAHTRRARAGAGEALCDLARRQLGVDQSIAEVGHPGPCAGRNWAARREDRREAGGVRGVEGLEVEVPLVRWPSICSRIRQYTVLRCPSRNGSPLIAIPWPCRKWNRSAAARTLAADNGEQSWRGESPVVAAEDNHLLAWTCRAADAYQTGAVRPTYAGLPAAPP